MLFADVKGSMELAEQLDPEEWHAILDRFFQILRPVFRKKYRPENRRKSIFCLLWHNVLPLSADESSDRHQPDRANATDMKKS